MRNRYKERERETKRQTRRHRYIRRRRWEVFGNVCSVLINERQSFNLQLLIMSWRLRPPQNGKSLDRLWYSFSYDGDIKALLSIESIIVIVTQFSFDNSKNDIHRERKKNVSLGFASIHSRNSSVAALFELNSALKLWIGQTSTSKTLFVIVSLLFKNELYAAHSSLFCTVKVENGTKKGQDWD